MTLRWAHLKEIAKAFKKNLYSVLSAEFTAVVEGNKAEILAVQRAKKYRLGCI